MPHALGIAGPAGPEKTALVEQLAQALAARGLKLGLALAAPPQDRPASALPRLEATGQGFCLSGPGLPSLDQMLARHFADRDLVLTDLHLDQRFLKLEFCPPGQAPTLTGDPGLRAIITAQPLDTPLPCFAPDQVPALAEHLVAKVLPPAKPHLVRIIADGRRIPAKEFVEEIVAGTIRALVSTLKGAEKAERLEVHL